MELIRQDDDKVTRLALVRAMRGITHATLGRQLGVDAVTILAWERGKEQMTPAQCKRAAMALWWPWPEFMLEPMPHDDAWDSLVKFRQANAK